MTFPRAPQKLWFPLLLGLIATLGLLSAASINSPWAQEARADAEAREKLNKREMKKLMNRWARELGVKCDYCHVKKGDQTDFKAPTDKKKIAAYCADNFVDKFVDAKKKKAINCQTCHERKATFLPKPKKK